MKIKYIMYMLNIWALAWLCVRVGILIICGKHSDDLIISLRGEIWVHKTSLSPQLFFIEVPVCIKPGKLVVMYVC